MIINIEIDENDHKSKEKFLKYIGRATEKPVKRTDELDRAFCTNAKLAYEYLVANLDIEYKAVIGMPLNRAVFRNPEDCRLSRELESIFSKNTIYAINYLAISNQKEFSDPILNKKIMKRVYDNPHYSFFYASYILKKRLPKDKEFVFLKSNKAMYHYAKLVVKDRLGDDIEKKLKLRTFSKEYSDKIPEYKWERKDIDYLKLYFREEEEVSKLQGLGLAGRKHGQYSLVVEHQICHNYIRKLCRF